MRTKTKLSPREARTLREVGSLKQDNKSTLDAWILTDQKYVWIYNQRNGQEARGHIMLTKKQFNQLIDWYNGETR